MLLRVGRLLLTCVCCLVPCLAANILSQTGDVVTYVNRLVIPGAGTNAFAMPNDASIAGWRPVVDALYGGNYQKAADLADPLNYNVVQFADTGRGRTYYILVERTNAQANPMRGLGTYLFNPTACRRLSIQAPHAVGDENTRAEAVTLFADLNATALLVAGTHRCSSSGASTCDGSTAACGDGKFHTSDVAHFTQNYFEPAHEEILKTIPNLITVAVHGEGEHSPDIVLSNGTCQSYSTPSAVTLLSNQYNQIFQQLGVNLKSGTCSSGSASTSLCAETDVQGRFANHSTTLCNCASPTRSACSSTLGCARNVTFPEGFIHLEQDCQLRQVPGCAVPGVGYQTAVSAFAAVFPCSPRIDAVEQGASLRADPLAPGSLFTLVGDGLGAAGQADPAAASFSLGGFHAQICGIPARLTSNSGTGQVNGIVPVGVAGNDSCDLTAMLDSAAVPATPATAKVQIVTQNIALIPFAVNPDLTIPTITDADGNNIGPPGAGLVQAQAGASITLWVTGAGLTSPVVPDDQQAPDGGAPVQLVPGVQIAGEDAGVSSAVLAAGMPGVYQITVMVPPDAPSGKVTLTIASGIGPVNYDLWVQ